MKKPTSSRGFRRIALLVFAVVAIAGIYQAYRSYRLMTWGTAFQAIRLCSDLFVSGRGIDEILAEDLAPNAGDKMKPTVNYSEISVTSTTYGIA